MIEKLPWADKPKIQNVINDDELGNNQKAHKLYSIIRDYESMSHNRGFLKMPCTVNEIYEWLEGQE